MNALLEAAASGGGDSFELLDDDPVPVPKDPGEGNGNEGLDEPEEQSKLSTCTHLSSFSPLLGQSSKTFIEPFNSNASKIAAGPHTTTHVPWRRVRHLVTLSPPNLAQCCLMSRTNPQCQPVRVLLPARPAGTRDYRGFTRGNHAGFCRKKPVTTACHGFLPTRGRFLSHCDINFGAMGSKLVEAIAEPFLHQIAQKKVPLDRTVTPYKTHTKTRVISAGKPAVIPSRNPIPVSAGTHTHEPGYGFLVVVVILVLIAVVVTLSQPMQKSLGMELATELAFLRLVAFLYARTARGGSEVGGGIQRGIPSALRSSPIDWKKTANLTGL
ncbi:hypothetical protein EDB84DRAFT_1443900 [Lactarius hengduanensis]|nr:hypothetical protein EDB84DRAFT_1443900 [Lactarius hengduanensis]